MLESGLIVSLSYRLYGVFGKDFGIGWLLGNFCCGLISNFVISSSYVSLFQEDI